MKPKPLRPRPAMRKPIAGPTQPPVAAVETRRLADLKPYPAQGDFFEDLSEYQLTRLADDIKQNGLKEKIEVLPDGTIVSGHQRCRALLLLGHSEQDVIVRYDLEAHEERATERYFIEANQNRRHSDPLSRARAALRLFELEQGRDPGDLTSDEDSLARDRVGKMLNMSGRNLARYWNLLQAPLVVQKAFQAGELRLDAAARVGTLPDGEKGQIAARIAQGEAATEVVAEVLQARHPRPTEDHQQPWQSLQQAIQTAVRGLQGHEEAIAGRFSAKELAIVRQGHALFGKLLRLAEQGQQNERSGGHGVQRRRATGARKENE